MLRLLYLLLAMLVMSVTVFADDVGIAEVRFIEEDINTYILEVDLSPYLLNTIQRPILPKRCNFIGEPEQVPVGPIRVVRYRFTSGDSPLQPDEELLLYWQRSGVVLTAYWMDGASHRAYFDRELAGIRIPISRLREINISTTVLLGKGFRDVVAHLKKSWLLHLLLVIACTTIGSVKSLVRLLLAFSAGQGLSMVCADIGLTFIFPGHGIIMMGIASLMMLIPAAYNKWKFLRFWPVLLMLGLLHGLGYAGPDFEQPIRLSALQVITSRLAFNISIDIFHVFTGMGIWGGIFIGNMFKLADRYRQTAVYLAGGITVAAVFLLIPNALVPPAAGQKILGPTPAAPVKGNISRTPSRPVKLSEPMLGFVTISAFEVRCEWLIRVRDLNPPSILSESGEIVLPVSVQATLKDELIKRFSSETLVTVDGKKIESRLVKADFVSVGNYGISTRPSPIPEPKDNAVIGLTLAYVVEEAPSAISLRLQPYPESVSAIPVAFTDPWGSTPQVLSGEFPQANWKRRMAGFRRPEIRAVIIEPVTWPILSGIMFILAGSMFFFIQRGWTKYLGYTVILMSFFIAMVSYPFVRVAVPSVLAKTVPAKEEMSNKLNQLLSNIYRAFDYRTEEAIYDRLAVSATGDQLASIYLQHRSAMEIENRGGARASVDNVEVLEIREVTPTADGISLDADWIVSGSVNHFGHIHYRKNHYKANVIITSLGGVWKISGIAVEEEKRII